MRYSMRGVALVVGALASTACSGSDGDAFDDERTREAAEAIEACPPAETVLGIDIASYQHPGGAAIDWATVAANRRFVIVKATEGTGYTNDYYADDVVQARANGMIAGAYHWLHYTSSGAAQAQSFLAAVGGNIPDGDLPGMLDVEETNDSSSPGERTAIMQEFLDTVEAVTGRKMMIYSGSWYWGPYMGGPPGYSGVYPMVWAAYVDGCPKVPDDFVGLTMWQYQGGGGVTPGIAADCDQDMFYGSEADLQALAHGSSNYFRGESLGKEGQSYPIVADAAVDVEQGQTVTGWVKLKNTGGASWMPGAVWLAPIPRDAASPYASPSWENDHRISTVKAEVKPGEVGEFELDITGAKEIGEEILSLGWVADAITWFADAPKGGGPPDGYFAVKVNTIEATEHGTGGSGGGTGAGVGGGAVLKEDAAGEEDSGCGCRIERSRSDSTAPGLLALAALGCVAGLRRRRARG